MDNVNETNKPTPQVAPRPTRRRRLKRPSLKLLQTQPLFLLAIVIAVGLAIFFYTKYNDSQDKLKHPEVVAQAQTQALVDKVSQLAILPSGEQPTVATVSDVSKLSSQTFFANAQNGDKVLIYGKAQKAILYRPSTNKIINIAPLNVNNAATSTKK